MIPAIAAYGRPTPPIRADRLGALALLSNVLVTAVLVHPDRGELAEAGERSTTMHPARGLFLGVAPPPRASRWPSACSATSRSRCRSTARR